MRKCSCLKCTCCRLLPIRNHSWCLFKCSCIYKAQVVVGFDRFTDGRPFATTIYGCSSHHGSGPRAGWLDQNINPAHILQILLHRHALFEFLPATWLQWAHIAFTGTVVMPTHCWQAPKQRGSKLEAAYTSEGAYTYYACILLHPCMRLSVCARYNDFFISCKFTASPPLPTLCMNTKPPLWTRLRNQLHLEWPWCISS